MPEGHGETPAAGGNPLDAVLDGEAQRLLHEALEGLPPEQRAVFVLRAVEDMSYREIAQVLGVRVGTVRSRIARGRDRLRLMLEDEKS